jgi:hypothetical protein
LGASVAQHNHGIIVLGQVNDLTGASWWNITNIDIADIPQIKEKITLEHKLCIGLAHKFTLKQWTKNPEREFEIKGNAGEYIKYCVYLKEVVPEAGGTIEIEVLHISTRNPNVV